jgi:ribosome-binding ATPase YchF (GTP1/OBG family)
VKIGIFSIPDLNPGKQNIKDSRLDQIHNIIQSKKKTYIQVELAGENAFLETDAILAMKDSGADLILKDLEFIETRLGRAEQEQEKALLTKLKNALEKEQFICGAGLNEEEKKAISGYGLITDRPVILIEKNDLEDPNDVLAGCVLEAGFISFFTAGEREARAWLIRKGTSAWEAAGEIHSDIQKGFIRAEVISFNDFISSGGETQAKQAGKMRLELKEYVMQDGDIVNFRFNK